MKGKRYWITIAVLLAAFVAICVTSFTLFFRGNAARVEETNLYYLEQDSGRLADRLELYFQDSMNYLNNISYIFTDSSISRLEELQRLLENLAVNSPFDSLYFTYTDGTSYRFTGENINVADREHFQNAMNGKSGITRPLISRMTGKRALVCYTPVFDKKEEICAVLIGVHYLDKLEKQLGSTFMDERVYSAVVAGDGEIIAESKAAMDNLFVSMEGEEITGETTLEDMKRDMQEGRSGQLSYAGLHGTSLIMYRPLTVNSWYVIQNLPSAALKNMESSVNQAAFRLVAGLTVGFVVLFAVLYIWTRRRHNELYMENQRVGAIVASSYSLLMEYEGETEKVSWFGDAGRIFNVNGLTVGLSQLLHPEDEDIFRRQLADLQSGKEYAADMRFRTASGEYHWCSCRMVAIHSLSGKIIRTLGIVSDMDEQKRREMRITDERDLLAEAISLLGDVYYKIVVVNLERGECRYVKVRQNELNVIHEGEAQAREDSGSYQFWYEVMADKMVHPDDRENFARYMSLENLRQEIGPDRPHMELVYQRLDIETGEYKWVQTDCILCENQSEAMIYVRDITEEQIEQEKHRQELEKALAEVSSANRVKADFLEYISHDLRTPMNAVMGMNQLARRAVEAGDMEKAGYYTERVQESSEYLGGLLMDLVDMSRMRTGSLQLQAQPFDIGRLAPACREFFDYIRKKEGITFRIQGALTGEYIGDFVRMKQLVFNLIENAVKFNRPGGSVLLELLEEPAAGNRTRIRLLLQDTGIGMKKEQLDRLFQPFSRGERIVSDTYSGTGIGLYIVKYIIDAMHGRIQMESTLGIGTTVKAEFELERTKRLPDITKKRRAAENGAARTVLVVDDNELNLEIAAALIEDEGCRVLTAENGAKALEIFGGSAEGEIDIILTDISMPEMDGYELAAAIRAMDRRDAGKVQIVALSAYGYDECSDKVKKSGMDVFLNKPFDMMQFKEILERGAR